jgi:hypothetical protein
MVVNVVLYWLRHTYTPRHCANAGIRIKLTRGITRTVNDVKHQYHPIVATDQPPGPLLGKVGGYVHIIIISSLDSITWDIPNYDQKFCFLDARSEFCGFTIQQEADEFLKEPKNTILTIDPIYVAIAHEGNTFIVQKL